MLYNLPELKANTSTSHPWRNKIVWQNCQPTPNKLRGVASPCIWTGARDICGLILWRFLVQSNSKIPASSAQAKKGSQCWDPLEWDHQPTIWQNNNIYILNKKLREKDQAWQNPKHRKRNRIRQPIITTHTTQQQFAISLYCTFWSCGRCRPENGHRQGRFELIQDCVGIWVSRPYGQDVLKFSGMGLIIEMKSPKLCWVLGMDTNAQTNRFRKRIGMNHRTWWNGNVNKTGN